MLKYLACLIGVVALLAVVPPRGEAAAKPAPVQKQDKAQGPAQNQPPAQGSRGQTSQPMGPPAPPPPAPPEHAPFGPALDKLSASLKQIEASLERHDLTDADLQALRQRIDPISDAVSQCARPSDPAPRRDQGAPRPARSETGRFRAARKPGGDGGARRPAKAL